jgi:predicted DsbA family dithiol-disulfide isomerase
MRLADRFGAARFAQMAEHLRRFAAQFGIPDLRVPERIPNTRRVLGLAEWARDQGRLHPFREAAMAAHWSEGLDLEDEGVLAETARRAGLDPRAARAALADPVHAARVDAMGAEAARAGVTGIPTFIIGRRRVVGCQPYQLLAAEAEAAGAERRR